MKTCRLISLFIIALLILTACGKNDKEYSTYYLSQEYKDYVVYKVGSYWIYEDSASKSVDSIYLYNQEIKMHNGNQKINYNAEGISENKTSSLFDTLIFFGGGTRGVW